MTNPRIAVVPASEAGPAESATPDESPILLSLKARRSEIAQKLWVDLKVPRWEAPEVFVRYGPIDTVKIDKAVLNRQKSNKEDWSLAANADILIGSCQGVYACLDGDRDRKYSLRENDENGSWTKFDPDLARQLGLDPDVTKAVDVVRKLYFTDGDLIAASNEVFNFSSESNERIDTDF
jgi:hypothetical protein